MSALTNTPLCTARTVMLRLKPFDLLVIDPRELGRATANKLAATREPANMRTAEVLAAAAEVVAADMDGPDVGIRLATLETLEAAEAGNVRKWTDMLLTATARAIGRHGAEWRRCVMPEALPAPTLRTIPL